MNKTRLIVGAIVVVALFVVSVISVNFVRNTVEAEDIFLPLTVAQPEGEQSVVLALASVRRLNPGDTLTVSCSGTNLSGSQINATTVQIACNGGPTPTATPTAVVPPTATAVVPPTAIPPTATPAGGTPAPTAQPASMLVWHAPAAHDGLNVHEHGAQPPAWANNWSTQEFGRGIQFGGDEASSPMENTHKHQAFKFIVAKSDAGGDVLLRYHAASNPMDRAAQVHSYEVYYRDVAGNISFWQGVYDTGSPAVGTEDNTARCPRRTPPLGCENQRPIILVTDATSLAQGIASEQWYMFASPESGLSWDMGVTIIGSTTVYKPGEVATSMDMATWQLTGNLGLRRRSDGFWYRGRGGNKTGWFCAEPLGVVVSNGNKVCPAGSLPQYMAPTLGADARPDGFGNNRIGWLVELDFPGNGVTVPN